MEIKYLQKLSKKTTKSKYKGIPMSLKEIEKLEELYNDGNPFPKVLKEFLYLAGNYCPVLDTGIYHTLQDLQEYVREELLEYGKVYTRPFFALETYSGDWCILMYLDEGDNPDLYHVYYNDEAADFNEPYKKLGRTLLGLINKRIR